MNLGEYQTVVVRYLKMIDTKRLILAGLVSGVQEEVNELRFGVHAYIVEGGDLDLARTADDLGDIMAFVTFLADTLGLQLEDIAAHNLEKLRDRHGGERQ